MRALTILLLISLPCHASDRRVPFFDNDPDTKYAPEYSFISNPIDTDVLQICGEFGSKVSRNSIKDLLAKYPIVNEKLLSIDSSLSTHKLLDIWTKNDGFAHIFCGELDGSLGGLHYAPRYKELYEKGVISMCPPNNANCPSDKNEIVVEKGIYSIPVSYTKKRC